MPTSSPEIRLLTRVCWLYYRESLTQEIIARRLGLTRKRVNHLLAQARELGIVQISITGPQGLCAALEQRLTRAFGLEGATVVPSPMQETDVRAMVGAALGDLLSARLVSEARIGVSWGGTIHAATTTLRPGQASGLTVVQLVGGLARSARFNPFDNASQFSRALDAGCYYLPAPMIADTPELRDLYVASPQVAEVLQMAAGLDIAVLTAVDLSEASGGLEYSVIDRAQWASLRDAGAVGDIAGHYLDREGRPVDHPISRRTINPPLDSLRNAKERLLAAGGAHKAEIVLAGIRAGLVRWLITDESCAAVLLDGRG
ncbi:sugar-binding transcriptional regulator [Geminicoccaceae bacterium 1502E]|nr:sugar-binding transcriptional regulator [Geminicoccaceae bacterium 1502E]